MNQINHSADRLNSANFDVVFQYGGNFREEELCYQDGVAPQIGVNGLSPNFNVFIPMTLDKEPIRNFLDAHYIDSYGWLFTGDNQNGKIEKRNP